MLKQRGELIALATATTEGSLLTIQLLRAGEFTDMNGKTFALTEADLDLFVANSNALLQAQEIPTQIGHPDDAGAPASGWYKKFLTRVINGIKWVCAQVELTAVGTDALSKNLYKYFSAELFTSTKEIVGGGFVNYPAVGGQQVVGTLAASAYLHPKESRMKLPQFVQDALGYAKRAAGWVKLEMSQEEASQKLWEALREKYGDPLDEYNWNVPWIKATYADRVIVEKGGECFQIEYSFDGDAVTLGTAVPVEIVYQPKTETETAAALGAPRTPAFPPGGETVTKEQEIEQVRKEEREKAELAARAHQEELRLAREDERKRVLAEQARKDEVRKLAADLTTGKFAFPQTPADLEAVLLKLSDEDRELIKPVLLKVKQSGLVDLGEQGHSQEPGGGKALDAGQKRALEQHLAAGKTLDLFVRAAGWKAGEFDLSAYESAGK